MTLRARLTLFFVGIVVVPLLVAGFILRGLVSGEVERRANTRLEAASRGVRALWSERVRQAGREVEVAARELVGRRPDLDGARFRGGLDFLVLAGPGGGVLASSVEAPEFRPGVTAPSSSDLKADPAPPGVLRAEVDVVSGARRMLLVGGWFADADLAGELAEVTGLDVAIVDDGRLLATTGPRAGASRAGAVVELDDELRGLLVPTTGQDSGVVLVTSLGARVTSTAIWIVAAAGVGLAVILGWALAGVIVRPLERLAEGARAVAAGDLGTRVEPGGQGDVANLADAFNSMTMNLRSYVEELKGSRDELRRGLDRLGAALRATHDLRGMVAVVLETAQATLRAEAGALFLLGPTGSELRLEVARGYRPPEGAMLPVGHGIAGRAAAGATVRVPGGAPVRAAVPVEPAVHTAVAVPLAPRDRAIGAIALYGCSIPEPFGEEDANTLRSLAAQAAVAIENVLLHQEAQRLSVTDSLTGAANRRSLESTLAGEVQRAQRFTRPLSVLMLDLDRFKDVNDEHGHRRGDEVLVEVTARIMSQIRTQIDTLARYGGEEFVIVLPETPSDGARVVAEKIRSVVRDQPFSSPSGPDLHMTVSIGTATFPMDGQTSEELLHSADAAMYRAKEDGRDRVVASP